MKNKIYFLADAHLGSVSHMWNITDEQQKEWIAQGKDPSLHVHHEVERKLCRWFDMVKADAETIYLMGDIFDYWFEYKNVVPRGFTRVLGKISELSDMGIDMHFFIGNHDIWLSDYLQNECGMTIHRAPIIKNLLGKKFLLAHGDGLGEDSRSFMILRAIFHSKVCRWLYASVHPRWTVGFAHMWSNSRRSEYNPGPYLGEDKEHLVNFAKKKLEEESDINYFIFGHRHILLDLILSKSSRIAILGDWISFFSYAVFDGENFSLEVFEQE